MSYKPPYTLSSKMVNQVSEISILTTKLEYLKLDITTPKLRKKSRIESITGTLQIEGNSFSKEQVTGVIEGKTVLGTVHELAEVEGAIDAYDNFDAYNAFIEKDLLKSHALLMSKLLNNAGKYRNTNVGVGSADGVTHVAPPSQMVPELMGALFGWLEKSEENFLIKSCVFHYEFEFIHPFSDGNGRVGRLWQSVILNEARAIFGYLPIESMVRENQDAYYKALEDAGSVGESTPFVEFMLDVIYKTLKKVEKEHKNDPLNVPKNVPLNRLENILKIIKKDKDVTALALASQLKVSEKTIKRDIAKLKKEHKLQRVGSLKGGHWELLTQ